MSRHAKRVRTLAATLIAIAATNIAISKSFTEPRTNTEAFKVNKGAIPIIPDPPRPKNGLPMIPDVPRP